MYECIIRRFHGDSDYHESGERRRKRDGKTEHRTQQQSCIFCNVFFVLCCSLDKKEESLIPSAGPESAGREGPRDVHK